ncbi:FMN-binding protein [Oceanotoga sp. DSM 15011]|jgi:Na+-transporting NADH:ubiquinone oxidoreductase subunit C|uniref:Na+-transporting NADH:ubiquinone oxidoreductase subunit C n=1 Tax=Oceanotoga teriensis TaxID=515440 RepID=A0AA45HJQ0_9BACT|nr:MULTISPECIES: FMN-binding protein [Oceanotoga]MDN5341636.1 Na+-transporting NADH:ubiquinone oxidoreductase subunit [Oceanotoga sp.]MDO7977161.1 FMN-binding protein [Oceanotoga teriensis]PWJ96568.1 Na+-transporting NADH:ubiquinone oxidoreductase subunit C [Oceanotoga teriensis]UYP00258.1 FMN-binding protein [Oceanotoga sp. DSM 15011]
MKKQSKSYTIIFTFIVSFIFVFVLALANELTKEQIVKNQQLFERKAVLNAFGIIYENDDEAFEKYEDTIKIEKYNDEILYEYEKNDEKFYGFKFTGNGLWGTITGILAVNSDVSQILGIDFISHNETPGLGGRIEEEWFKDQFKNEKIINNNIKVIVGGGEGDLDKENSEIDSITGATRTSESVQKITNDTIYKIKTILGVNE